jgi:transposase
MLVNAQHIKAVPGRKTDVKDAQWIAQLLQHGLLRPSFIPPIAQRDLRDLTRHRTNFIRERVNLVNRIQKVLEGANIKLASVVSDVMGVTGRAILNAIAVGETDPVAMAQLAKGSLCNKRDLLAQSRSWASAASPAIHFG